MPKAALSRGSASCRDKLKAPNQITESNTKRSEYLYTLFHVSEQLCSPGAIQMALVTTTQKYISLGLPRKRIHIFPAMVGLHLGNRPKLLVPVVTHQPEHCPSGTSQILANSAHWQQPWWGSAAGGSRDRVPWEPCDLPATWCSLVRSKHRHPHKWLTCRELHSTNDFTCI